MSLEPIAVQGEKIPEKVKGEKKKKLGAKQSRALTKIEEGAQEPSATPRKDGEQPSATPRKDGEEPSATPRGHRPSAREEG